jgi:hypothetical protein
LNRFVSDGENKYYLSFTDEKIACNVITFGVGMDFSGEAEFARRYPNCQLTAVDPLSKGNRELVESVRNARFIQALIGGRNQTYLANIKHGIVAL